MLINNEFIRNKYIFITRSNENNRNAKHKSDYYIKIMIYLREVFQFKLSEKHIFNELLIIFIFHLFKYQYEKSHTKKESRNNQNVHLSEIAFLDNLFYLFHYVPLVFNLILHFVDHLLFLLLILVFDS